MEVKLEVKDNQAVLTVNGREVTVTDYEGHTTVFCMCWTGLPSITWLRNDAGEEQREAYNELNE